MVKKKRVCRQGRETCPHLPQQGIGGKQASCRSAEGVQREGGEGRSRSQMAVEKCGSEREMVAVPHVFTVHNCVFSRVTQPPWKMLRTSNNDLTSSLLDEPFFREQKLEQSILTFIYVRSF